MFFRQRRLWSFHVVVLQRTEKKCTKNYSARAQTLFCSLNFLFSDVTVAFAVVVLLNSLLGPIYRYDFVACDKFTTGLRHELFRVNQT